MRQLNDVGCISTRGQPVVHHLTNHVSQPIYITVLSSFYASSDMLFVQFIVNDQMPLCCKKFQNLNQEIWGFR